MLVMGARVVIPRSQVQRVINTLLSMHQRASKIRQRARISVYWPGIDAEILNAASQCEECTARLPSQQKEIIRHREKATRPFEFIHADIGEDNGRHFLVIVDHFSGWSHFKMFQDKSTSAARLIDEFRNFFTAIGGATVSFDPTTASSLQLNSRIFYVIGTLVGAHHHPTTRNQTEGRKQVLRP